MTDLKLATLVDSLRELLKKLDHSNYIEYGGISDFYTLLRIRRMQVFGFTEYRVTMVSRGTEGSGAYYKLEDEQSMCDDVMAHVAFYHRPTIRYKRRLYTALRPGELSFYLRNEVVPRDQLPLEVHTDDEADDESFVLKF